MVSVTTFYKYIIQQYSTVTAPHAVLRAIIPSLQISTPTAVLRFDSVVGNHFTLVISLFTVSLHKENIKEP